MWAVTPTDDLEPHDKYNSMCKCGPKVIIREDGDLLIVHNSFDGRELVEQAEEILNQKRIKWSS